MHKLDVHYKKGLINYFYLTIFTMTTTLITGHTVSICTRLVATPQGGIQHLLRIDVEEVIAWTIAAVGKPEAGSEASREAAARWDVEGILQLSEAVEIREVATEGVATELWGCCKAKTPGDPGF